MTDLYKASDRKPTWLSRPLGSDSIQRPGTLSPAPWHFALFASSMILGQGDTSVLTASPMPPDCCGARGACQQSPILRSSPYRLPEIPGNGKGCGDVVVTLKWAMPLNYCAIGPKRKMPGVWGQSTQEFANATRMT